METPDHVASPFFHICNNAKRPDDNKHCANTAGMTAATAYLAKNLSPTDKQPIINVAAALPPTQIATTETPIYVALPFIDISNNATIQDNKQCTNTAGMTTAANYLLKNPSSTDKQHAISIAADITNNTPSNQPFARTQHHAPQ